MHICVFKTVHLLVSVVGFLSTHDVHAPGNYALLDQVAALRWVADNIRSFGGDPTNVTLMGHGVGGAMINLLMLSPTTAGGFIVCQIKPRWLIASKKLSI